MRNTLCVNLTKNIHNMLKKIYGIESFYIYMYNYANGDLEAIQILKNTTHVVYNNQKVVIPMGFYNKFNFNNVIKLTDCAIDKDITKSYTLYANQKEIFNKIISQYNIPIYTIVKCPCGFGKTILSLELICHYKQKTLIITPLKKLAEQWYDTIKNNTNLSGYCSINGIDKFICDIITKKYDSDVIICPDKHLRNKVVLDYIYKNIGLVLIDEIHSYNFYNDSILNKFLHGHYFSYCFGLSATPNNNYKIHFNSIITSTECGIIKLGCINNIQMLYSNQCINKPIYRNYKDRVRLHTMYKSYISSDDNRNKVIISFIKYIVNNNTKALVLTDFRLHMNTIYDQLKHIDHVYKYDVRVKDYTYNNINNISKNDKYIIISTIKALYQAIDLHMLNDIHILLPITSRKYIIQIIGRMQRNLNNTKNIYYYNFGFLHNDYNIFIKDGLTLIKNTLINWTVNNINLDIHDV